MKSNTDVKKLFELGAHFGYSRARRHPSAQSFIFTSKDRSDIFDLERTVECFDEALGFVKKTAESGKQILFIGGKNEISALIHDAAQSAHLPYVDGRWIGGTLTNFKEIRRRIDRLERLRGERDRNERDKYTKRERLMFDREIEELENRFGGLVSMTQLPAVIFVVDPRYEETAVREANQIGIPVIALASSDCDFSALQYPIPANDSAKGSVEFFVNAIRETYTQNRKAQPAPKQSE